MFGGPDYPALKLPTENSSVLFLNLNNLENNACMIYNVRSPRRNRERKTKSWRVRERKTVNERRKIKRKPFWVGWVGNLNVHKTPYPTTEQFHTSNILKVTFHIWTNLLKSQEVERAWLKKQTCTPLTSDVQNKVCFQGPRRVLSVTRNLEEIAPSLPWNALSS